MSKQTKIKFIKEALEKLSGKKVLFKEGSTTDFIANYASELKDAVKQLKEISKIGEPSEEVQQKLKDRISKYDTNVLDFILSADDYVTIDNIVDLAMRNEMKWGTEPQMVIFAIDEAYNLLSREGLIKGDEMEEALQVSTDTLMKKPDVIAKAAEKTDVVVTEEIKEDGWAIAHTPKEFEELVKEMQFNSVEDFQTTTGVSFDELKGKEFQLIHDRIYFKENKQENTIQMENKKVSKQDQIKFIEESLQKLTGKKVIYEEIKAPIIQEVKKECSCKKQATVQETKEIIEEKKAEEKKKAPKSTSVEGGAKDGTLASVIPIHSIKEIQVEVDKVLKDINSAVGELNKVKRQIAIDATATGQDWEAKIQALDADLIKLKRIAKLVNNQIVAQKFDKKLTDLILNS